MIQVVLPLPWLKQIKPAVADIEVAGTEVAPDEARGAVVANKHNQAE